MGNVGVLGSEPPIAYEYHPTRNEEGSVILSV